MKNKSIQLLDSRRLTGANLFWEKPGAIIDIEVIGINNLILIECWQKHIEKILNSIGWNTEKHTYRVCKNSLSLVISAPIDCLYAATEVNEAALELCRKELLNPESNNSYDSIINNLYEEIKQESNPNLLALVEYAEKNKVPVLVDDDNVSLGYGKSCVIFNIHAIPEVNKINWLNIASIPVALVTGTNGKSTTVRLASSIIKSAGISCGITSTDYIRVGEEILDHGDYSGPGGARTLLRHPQTEIALLEVARGGLLRRGLGVNQATTVAITNVAEDHLGEYGIDNLTDMIEAKFIVRQAIEIEQNLILNADDLGCVKFAQSLKNTIIWFSTDKNNPVVLNHIKNGGSACYVEDSIINFHDSRSAKKIINVTEIPITFEGAAVHNIQNALTAVAMSVSLGIDSKYIHEGLKSFNSTPENNPGRGNYFERKGVKIIVDFAHNEHGLKSMAQTIKQIPANRRLILIGQAGDRSDELIKGFVQAALSAGPDKLIISDLPGELRGREKNEVPKLIKKFALNLGMQAQQIKITASSFEGAKEALNWAKPGDLLLLLALTERDEIIKLISN